MVFKVAIKKFLKNLTKALSHIFKTTKNPLFPKDVHVILLSSKRQKEFVEKLSCRYPIINLDRVTADVDTGLDVSRLFAISETQLEPLSIVGRLSSHQTSDQLSKLKPGSYYLVDDDIATGSTMNKIEGILPKGIKISKRISLAEIDCEYQKGSSKEYQVLDLVDARDLLFGSKESGLLVELFNGDHARVPYLPPFVNLVTRLSLPPEEIKQFSHTILQLNREFFNSLPFQINIKDVDESFQKLLYFIGFSPENSILEVIDWWEEHLVQSIPSKIHGH